MINIYSFYSDEDAIDQLRQRFNGATKRDSNSGCLLWLRGKDNKGYGRLWIGYRREGTLKKELAHRVAWLLSKKIITDEKPFILHSCDNPLCCEISHLWDGTAADNNLDRTKKDRTRRSKRGMPRGVQPNSEKDDCSYQARVQIGPYQKYLGSYPTIEEAYAVASAAQKIIDSGGSLL